MSDLISRADAIDAMDKLWGDIKRTNKRVAKGHEAVYLDMRGTIKTLPSADRPTTDCTKFMEWLKAEVLDEENWELNAVANGEIICRKFRKLGWLDVEDGYYVDTRPTGEWTDNHNGTFTCDQCGCKHSKSNYCPNCGARMEGGEEE